MAGRRAVGMRVGRWLLQHTNSIDKDTHSIDKDTHSIDRGCHASACHWCEECICPLKGVGVSIIPIVAKERSYD